MPRTSNEGWEIYEQTLFHKPKTVTIKLPNKTYIRTLYCSSKHIKAQKLANYAFIAKKMSRIKSNAIAIKFSLLYVANVQTSTSFFYESTCLPCFLHFSRIFLQKKKKTPRNKNTLKINKILCTKYRANSKSGKLMEN